MKRLCVTMLIGVVWLAGSSQVNAQDKQARQPDRRFGNGRFLKRIKDDLDKSQAAEAARKAKAKLAEEAKAAQQKLAQAASKYTRPVQPASTQKPGNGPAFGQLRAASAPSRNQPTPARAQAAPLTLPVPPQPDENQFEVPPIRRARPQGGRQGFGLSVELRGEQLVITQIDPRGNAREAGLQVGDVIVSGGGVEFKSVEDLQQIADILEDGDQLEFAIQRRGKSQQVLLGYGNPPAVEDGPVAESILEQAPTQGAQVNLRDNYSFLPESEPRIIPSRPTPAPRQTAPVAQVPTRDPSTVIAQQQRQIELLKQQLQQLQQQAPSSRSPRVLNAGSSQAGPVLGGPK